MMKVCVIEGDGIGKEVIPEAVKILNELGDFEIIKAEAGLECLKKYGDALPEETIEKAKEAQLMKGIQGKEFEGRPIVLEISQEKPERRAHSKDRSFNRKRGKRKGSDGRRKRRRRK